MKRLYSFFVGIVAIILVLWGISYKLEDNSTQGTIDKLVIYNWGDYIDPELLDEFTAETGIQVDYQTFDSNESMYTKIKQGGNNLRFSSSIRIYDFQNDGGKYAG